MVSATYFLNLGNQQYTKNLNNINPQYQLQYQNGLNQQVANPFYNHLTPTLFLTAAQPAAGFAGFLAGAISAVGGLYELGVLGAGERYHSVELKGQKAFSKGYNFLISYVYIRERTQTNTFNDLDAYQNNLVYQDSNQPHHRFNIASTAELPFGKGHAMLNALPRAADAIVGGWKLAGLWTYTSGDYPRFGNLIVTGDPCVSNPSPQHWFNTAAFAPVPANTYVLRSNPLQYGCLVGPRFWNLDANLTKTFNITERIHAELKMAAYNATNRLNRGDPDTNVLSSTFGQALFQGSPGGSFGAQGATFGNQSGRQVEIGMKITF